LFYIVRNNHRLKTIKSAWTMELDVRQIIALSIEFLSFLKVFE
jgi:hypothetical protein